MPTIGKRLRKSVTLRACSHFTTFWLGTRLPDAVPLVFVVGYPKSGTTWVCQVVADYMQLPFPKGSILPVGCPAVVHGHETVWKSYRRGVYVLRDGRDTMASLYFHMARRVPDGSAGAKLRREWFGGGEDLIANPRKHFAAFIDRQMRKPFAARVHWGDHVRTWLDNKNPHIALIRYEDLLADGVNTLSAAMRAVTGSDEIDPERAQWAVEKFSFARQSGRKAGAEDRTTFLRKGKAGDWTNHFTLEAAEIFDRHCGQALIDSGYAPDRSWVQTCNNDTTPPAPREPRPVASGASA